MSQPIPSSHKECAECERVLPRNGAYLLRKADDPYGTASRAQDRRKRKGENLLSEQEYVALATSAPADPDRLWVQMVCKGCEHARWARRTSFRAMSRANPDAKIKQADSRWRTFTAKELPATEAEKAARAGLVRVDNLGVPVLPDDAVAALRVCYAALTSDCRPGALGSDRVALFHAVPGLVAQLPPSAMTARMEDVLDVALVRTWGPLASDAMTRILDRYRKHHARYAWAKIKAGLMDEEEALARLDEGILLGALKWDPIHESEAALSTRCGWFVRRTLQIRTRADRPLGVLEQDGVWTQGAASLSEIGVSDSDGAPVEQHCVHYTARGCTQNAAAAAADDDARTTLAADLAAALNALDPQDREIVTRVLLERESQAKVAADLGLSKAKLALRLATLIELLRDKLSQYGG